MERDTWNVAWNCAGYSRGADYTSCLSTTGTPTGFMTKSVEIARQLERKCDGMHRHIVLVGGRAKQAEVYPEELC